MRGTEPLTTTEAILELKAATLAFTAELANALHLQGLAHRLRRRAHERTVDAIEARIAAIDARAEDTDA